MKIGSADIVMIKIDFFRLIVKNVVLAFLFFLITFTIGCENDSQEISKVVKLGDIPPETINNLETLYSDSGFVRVRVTSPLLQKRIKPEAITEMPKGLHIEFFDVQLKVISSLTADYAIHLEKKKQWIAERNVVVVNQKGEQLNTEKLVWDEGKELLSSDQFVKIKTAQEIIYGDGFEANQDFSHYRIFNVKGRITVKQ
jgi:LPS export ABC transporter protein LptC